MNETLRSLIAVGIVVILVGLFIVSYILNKNTAKPEGCVDVTGSCSSCSIDGCTVRADNTDKGV